MAFPALLMAYRRQVMRRIAEFLSTLLGQPCCLAVTLKRLTQVIAALRTPYNELASQLPTQDRVSIEEMATNEQTGKAWWWTFVAQPFTVFAVRVTQRR